MNKIKKTFILLSFLFQIALQFVFPCTVAVISGKATADGRPLLWKNRDTSVENNKVIFIQGKKFGILGLVNANDSKGRSIWAGCNSAGFAIMNSASGDLAPKEEGMNGNGRFMRLALDECANVEEFEYLLLQTNGKRKVAANFGVIDALGNACIFETSAHSFVKFDANNPRFAPDGYIVRTNFAFSAPEPYTGGGYIRFERISRIFREAAGKRLFSVKFILQKAARDLASEKLHSYPLLKNQNLLSDSPLYINTNDTINRNSTQSVTVFKGAPSPAKAYLTTMWVILGQPVCSAALPCWPYAQSSPSVLTGKDSSPLNDVAVKIEKYLYPDRRGHMIQYLNVNRLLSFREEGVLTKILRLENEIFAKTSKIMKRWEKNQPSPEEIKVFAENTASETWQSLKEQFAEILEPESF